MLRRLIRWIRSFYWIDIPPGDPLSGGGSAQHDVEFVSRHSIAETGLICPVCETLLCERGNYDLVRKTRLGEAVRCTGKRVVNDEIHPCRKILVASPDTEHGDHLLMDKTPDESVFYRFVRLSLKEVIARQYGRDVVPTQEGGLAAVGSAPAPAVPYADLPKRTYLPGEILPVNDPSGAAKECRVLHFANPGDPYFKGWVYCVLDNMDKEWLLDPQGRIRRSMSDPSLPDLTLR